MGGPAIQSCTNSFGLKITQVRGKLYPGAVNGTVLSERGIVAAVHPAFILRGGSTMRKFMADVDYAMRLTKDAEYKKYYLPEVHVARSHRNLKWLSQEIGKHEYVSADIETGGFSGFDHLRDRVLCVGYCWDPRHVYIVGEEHVPHTGMFFSDNPGTKFIWHNGKFDVKFLWQLGIPARVDEDTLLLSYALDETKGIHDLEQISSDLLGSPDWKFMIREYVDDWKQKHRKQTVPGYAMVPSNVLHQYAARDISGTLQCFHILRNQVSLDPKLNTLYTKTLLPFSKYTARIESHGIRPDLEETTQNGKRLQAEADALEAAFNQYAIDSGFGALNPRSPIQVGSFLYDQLGLRAPRRPKARPTSTDEGTLASLQPHPAVKTLLKYREVQKALSTYVNALPQHVGLDGRIHTSYLIHGTTTGRFASRDPNLLNIPREPSLRGQFVAGPGNIFMEIDVNQAELRVLAELSRDPELVRIYTTPGHPSIHAVTQREMFGDPEQYTDDQWYYFGEKFSTQGNRERTVEEQNMRAKCVNFGVVYGRTPGSIAEEFRMPTNEAATWIEKWFHKYHGAYRFLSQCRMAPLKGMNLVTPFGRKRRFQVVNAERLKDIQNQAANFPEQSIAADCVAHTGIIVQDRAFHEFQAHIVNTVYDSLLFEMPNNLPRALELGAFVLSVLRDVPKRWGLSLIPFVGDIKVGVRWGSDPKQPDRGYMAKVAIPETLKHKYHL